MLKVLRLNEPRAHVAVIAAVFYAIGITLWLQPARYADTPSYANLLGILPQHAWSLIYVGTASLKVSAIWRYSLRPLVVVSHAVAIALESAWLVAFIIRYLTDSGTTIVNVVSWSVYLYLSVRSALMIDQHTKPGG